jgi:hypothetical protein
VNYFYTCDSILLINFSDKLLKKEKKLRLKTEINSFSFFYDVFVCADLLLSPAAMGRPLKFHEEKEYGFQVLFISVAFSGGL